MRKYSWHRELGNLKCKSFEVLIFKLRLNWDLSEDTLTEVGKDSEKKEKSKCSPSHKEEKGELPHTSPLHPLQHLKHSKTTWNTMKKLLKRHSYQLLKAFLPGIWVFVLFWIYLVKFTRFRVHHWTCILKYFHVESFPEQIHPEYRSVNRL